MIVLLRRQMSEAASGLQFRISDDSAIRRHAARYPKRVDNDASVGKLTLRCAPASGRIITASSATLEDLERVARAPSWTGALCHSALVRRDYCLRTVASRGGISHSPSNFAQRMRCKSMKREPMRAPFFIASPTKKWVTPIRRMGPCAIDRPRRLAPVDASALPHYGESPPLQRSGP